MEDTAAAAARRAARRLRHAAAVAVVVTEVGVLRVMAPGARAAWGREWVRLVARDDAKGLRWGAVSAAVAREAMVDERAGRGSQECGVVARAVAVQVAVMLVVVAQAVVTLVTAVWVVAARAAVVVPKAEARAAATLEMAAARSARPARAVVRWASRTLSHSRPAGCCGRNLFRSIIR